MYQSPDLVKVDLDIKDNFASYTSCIPDVYWIGGHVEGDCLNPGTSVSMLTEADLKLCYSTRNAPV